ncbi:MAG: hypothetical protein J6X05_08050, partial [Bacteroidales bacterium]|nr:hypothetical protein [Bacteroidales bacterium]
VSTRFPESSFVVFMLLITTTAIRTSWLLSHLIPLCEPRQPPGDLYSVIIADCKVSDYLGVEC